MAASKGMSECTVCQPGHFAPKGSIQCEICAAGQYADKKGAAKCIQCTKGRFQSETKKSLCSVCARGNYSPRVGLTECLDCYGGFYADNPESSICKACFLDTTSNKGKSECRWCAIGKVSEVGSPKCTACQEGKFWRNTTDWLSDRTLMKQNKDIFKCLDCQRGRFSTCLGITECNLCQEGRFVDTLGQTETQPCPEGTFADEKGLEQCKACPEGTSQAATGQETCLPCEQGRFMDGTRAIQCENCANGYFADGLGFKLCTECPTGRFADLNGTQICTKCRPGTFAPITGQTSCESCPRKANATDPMVPTYSLAGADACTPCKRGEVQPVHSSECIKCKPGSWSFIPGELSAESCHPCPVGSAFCPGGDEIVPRLGFWRDMRIFNASGPLSDGERHPDDKDFRVCHHKRACLGAIDFGNLENPGTLQAYTAGTGESNVLTLNAPAPQMWGYVRAGVRLSLGELIVTVHRDAKVDNCTRFDRETCDFYYDAGCVWDGSQNSCNNGAANSDLKNISNVLVLSETTIPIEETIDIAHWDLIALPEREGCRVGYEGTLCAVCSEGYYKAKYVPVDGWVCEMCGCVGYGANLNLSTFHCHTLGA